MTQVVKSDLANATMAHDLAEKLTNAVRVHGLSIGRKYDQVVWVSCRTPELGQQGGGFHIKVDNTGMTTPWRRGSYGPVEASPAWPDC